MTILKGRKKANSRLKKNRSKEELQFVDKKRRVL